MFAFQLWETAFHNISLWPLWKGKIQNLMPTGQEKMYARIKYWITDAYFRFLFFRTYVTSIAVIIKLGSQDNLSTLNLVSNVNLYRQSWVQWTQFVFKTSHYALLLPFAYIKPLSIPQQTIFLSLHTVINHEITIFDFSWFLFATLTFWVVRSHCRSNGPVYPVKKPCFFDCYRVQRTYVWNKKV